MIKSITKTNLTELNNLIDTRQAAWASHNKWSDPNLADGCDFLVTEVGELRRAFYGYTSTSSELATEAFDVYMMTRVTGRVAGVEVVLLPMPPRNPEAILKKLIDAAFNLIEARLRLNDQYTRNNPAPGDMDRLPYHLSEIATLTVDFVAALGLDFDEVGKNKLSAMEGKRK